MGSGPQGAALDDDRRRATRRVPQDRLRKSLYLPLSSFSLPFLFLLFSPLLAFSLRQFFLGPLYVTPPPYPRPTHSHQHTNNKHTQTPSSHRFHLAYVFLSLSSVPLPHICIPLLPFCPPPACGARPCPSLLGLRVSKRVGGGPSPFPSVAVSFSLSSSMLCFSHSLPSILPKK